MSAILLGDDDKTGKPVSIPLEAFRTHLHGPGATGKGKTTALLTMLYQLLLDPRHKACHIIVDFMGGLTEELLLWMSSRYCTQPVRDRLVLIQPSREDVVLPMNPLLYDTLDHGFFKVNRGVELILRAWEAQNLAEQPRLGRWLFNAFWASAQLGLTISDTRHLLLPGSPYHRPLLAALPEGLRYEWQELLDARSAEATRILESSRNRMKPFYEAGSLRNMFGSTINRLDILHFMREKKIVVLDLSPRERLSPQVANAIAGLTINEVLATARSLPKTVRYDTYCWLDEFQRLCTPDLEYAIPEVRQIGIRLALFHQSFSQLKKPDCDLTSIIFQPQTRLVFGEQGEDAEILAAEFASITYDEKRVLDEIYRLQQVQTGHQKVELSGWGSSCANARQWNDTYGSARSDQAHTTRRDGSSDRSHGQGQSDVQSAAHGQGGSATDTTTYSTREQLIPVLQNIRELASRTYYSVEQQRAVWAREIRNLRTGICLLRLVNDPTIYTVRVKQTRPGYLGFDPETIARRFPQVIEARARLLEANFRSEFFVSPQEIERETQERLQRILCPVITLQRTPNTVATPPADSPFAG